MNEKFGPPGHTRPGFVIHSRRHGLMHNMDDEDIEKEAKRFVRNVYGHGGRVRRYREKVQNQIAKLKRQRQKLLKVTSQGDDREDAVLVYGPHLKGVHGSCVDIRSEANMIRGLCKRIASKQSYDIQEIVRFKDFVIKFVREHYVPIPHVPMSHEFLDHAWLDGSKYNMEEKTKFHAELDKYLHSGIDINKILECKIFIKREITEEVKEPRIISSRTDTFKAVVAPYVKLIEDAIYDEHFIKHCSPPEVQERIGRVLSGYEYFYETDYSSFESSFSKPFIQACEYQLFKHMLSNNPEIWRVVEKAMTGDNVLVCPDLWATLPGSRMSGEMWTSLANGFSNMMMIRYMAHLLYKEKAFTYDFIVEGDDGLIGTTSEFDLSVVSRLGFRLTLRKGSHINDLSFCGMILGPTGRLYCNPERTLIKFGRTTDQRIISQRNNKNFKKLLDTEMYTKALSMSVYGSNNPVINECVQTTLRNSETKRIDLSMLDYWETDILEVQNHWNGRVRPLDEHDYQFAEAAFGIDVETLKKIGSAILNEHARNFSIRTRLTVAHDTAMPYVVYKREC